MENKKKHVHVAQNAGDNEWYTPSEFVEAARQAMGNIDIDPASSAIANETVKADKFFTKKDDGLSQPWYGAVWCNPPYAQPLIAQFAEAIVSRYESGEIQQACVLVNNATETKWFQYLLSVANMVCFPASRIRFISPDNKKSAPLQGQAIIYIGTRRSEFAKAFAQFGTVLPSCT